ncbi:MAG: aminoacyl--tRNA ligase-related protein [Anaerolineae bacterium]
MNQYFSTNKGLVTLGPELIEVVNLLESRFLGWAGEVGAKDMHFPTLLSTESLNKFDYFRNFPHLGTVVSRINAGELEAYAAGEHSDSCIPTGHLADGHFVLQPASCYNVYLHFEDSQFNEAKYITTNGHCFRNEKEYTRLTRLWGFHMREIVCIGSADEVKAHLVDGKQRILKIAEELDVTLTVEMATDPFFDNQSKRKLMQKLFPVKEEFVTHDGVAIASCNYHRNFFGERCNINLAEDGFAHTGCVAFGIERWLHALLDRYGNDIEAIKSACTIKG